MDTLGVGIIGFGFIGKVHALGYSNIPLLYDPLPVRTRLVGVATSRLETARKAAGQGGFEFGTDDWRALIARDDIHIINICSPNSRHPEQLLAAMEAGKHIYCDKPLVVGEDAMRQIATALPTYHGIGQMTFQYRCYPPTLRAKYLLDEGFLGNIISFRAAYLHAGNVDPSKRMGWRYLKAEGGGVLQDLGSHLIDLMDHLLGPFDSVLAEKRILYLQRPDAHGEMAPAEVDDQVVMLAKLRNGAIGTMEVSKIASGAEDDLRFEIHGDRGAIRFNLLEMDYLQVYDLREPASPLGGQRGWRKIPALPRNEKLSDFPDAKIGAGWLRGHLHCLYTFLQAVANGHQGEPSLRRGLQVQRMLAIAEASNRDKCWKSMAEAYALR